MLLNEPMDRLPDDPGQRHIAFLGDGRQRSVILVIKAHGQSGGLFSALGHGQPHRICPKTYRAAHQTSTK